MNDEPTNEIPSRTLVDNWMLESAFALLSKEWLEALRNKYGDKVAGMEWQAYSSENLVFHKDTFNERAEKTRQLVTGPEEKEQLTFEATSLLQLLDLIILNDELIYDSTWSHGWRSLNPPGLEDIVNEVRLGGNTRRALTNSAYLVNGLDYPDIVVKGAKYYLALSGLLGISYWPSPQRARFLEHNAVYLYEADFTTDFLKTLSKQVVRIITEAVDPLNTKQLLYLPQLGSNVLAYAERPSDIIPVALEMRRSEGAAAFRAWLRAMDDALVYGDAKYIAREMKEVRGLISSLAQELGVHNVENRVFEFQIGISPGVTLGKNVLDSWVSKFRRKPHHFVFLRSQFDVMVANSNVKYHLSRLFPDRNWK